MAAPTLTLPAAEIAKLKVGAATCMTVDKHASLVFKTADGKLVVAPNTCVHMGKKFVTDIEDAGVFRCSMHGAKLDGASMQYKSGPNFMKGLGTKCDAGTVHPQCNVTMNADGSATLSLPAGAKSGGCTIQ